MSFYVHFVLCTVAKALKVPCTARIMSKTQILEVRSQAPSQSYWMPPGI
jgi:hypothetical protein